MQRKYLILGLFFLLAMSIIVLGFGGLFHAPAHPLEHDRYAVIDVEQPTLIHQIEFREEYLIAVKTGAGWVQDPIQVGLRFAGYPNADSDHPDQVFAFFPQSNKAIVVVASLNCMDDSIRDHEERIDLVRDSEVWKTEWAGYRQRCRRSLSGGWVTGLCP